jgi:hypothetical protein
MPILFISDEIFDDMEPKETEKKLEAYSDIKLEVSFSKELNTLGLSASGCFPSSLNLYHIANMFDEGCRDKSRTLLCIGGEVSNYVARDLIHNYSERESIYLSAAGNYVLVGFKRIGRIFEAMDELRYFVSLQ